MRWGQLDNMASLGIIMVLGLIGCTYTAPESARPVLQDIVATASLSDSSPDNIRRVDSNVDHGIDIQAKDVNDLVAEKSSGVMGPGKTDGLDRGLVSDVIESTLSGMHLGFALGSNNGTIDRLCIKLGNITMAGCRRTATQDKKKSSDDHKDDKKDTKLGKNAMYDFTITLPMD